MFPFFLQNIGFSSLAFIPPAMIPTSPKDFSITPSIHWSELSLGSCLKVLAQPPSPVLQCIQPSGRGYPEVPGKRGLILP